MADRSSARTSIIGRSLRTILTIAAVALVAWAFVHVAVREWGRFHSDADTIELVAMHWSGDGGPAEDAIVDDALAAFEAAHPGVTVRRMNPGDAGSFYTKLQTMLASGEPPDVFYVGSERLPSFAAMGLLLPLDELVAADQGPSALALSAFYPETVKAFRYDGSRVGSGPLFGVPKDFTTVGFYYNKDLLRRAGVADPADDWTWDDFLAGARAVGQLPDATGAEFVTWPMMVRGYLQSAGLDVVGEDLDDIQLDAPEVMSMLEAFRSWRFDEENTLTSGRSKIASGSSVFLTGKVGFAGPFGRWVVPTYRNIPAPGAGGFDWDFAPLPRAAGEPYHPIAAIVSWSVARESKHPELAYQLVKALTDAEGQARMARLGLAIPTIRAVAQSDAFLDPTQEPHNDAGYLRDANDAKGLEWPVNPRFEQLLGSRLDQALRTGDRTLAQSAADFGRDWRAESASPLAVAQMPPMPWRRLAMITLVLAVVASIAKIAWLRGGRLSARERRTERWGFALASPWFVGFALFMAFPIVMSLALAFARWRGVSTLDLAQWAGVANFEQILLHDSHFRTSVRVTLVYALLAVPAGQAMALVAALLLNTRVRGIALFRAAWYLPSVLAGVGVSILWRWVFDPEGGLANTMLEPVLTPLGLSPPDWFGKDAGFWGPPAFAIMSLWFIGGSMIVYLAGLQQVPVDVLEAARIDGAGPVRRFFRVTLPLLSPVVLFNLIMSVIGSFQVFTQAFVMTGGEPGDLTRFYVLYLYNMAFETYEMGYASALAWILLLMIMALTGLLLRTSAKFVYYEGMKA